MNESEAPYTVLQGDCLEVLRTLPDASVDAVVTDPPYGLGEAPDMLDVLRAWLAGEPFRPKGRGGFMGKAWDSFVPGPEVWREVFRVLKPGGHLLCFAGTRTWDVMSVGIRLAGFESRDTIASEMGAGPEVLRWTYGSGFPKSYNVAKGIEGTLTRGSANWNEWQHLPGEREGGANVANGYTRTNAETGNRPRTYTSTGAYELEPTTDEAKRWEGWGTALKPAWEPILCFRKPLEGSIAANVLAHGTGALNIDACRVPCDDKTPFPRAGYSRHVTNTAYEFAGDQKFKTIGPDTHAAGRWPSNLVLSHALTCDAASGTCADGCPVAELGAQSGERKPATSNSNGKTTWYASGRASATQPGYGDTGTAARYFPQFRYVAKASRRERNRGCEGLPIRAPEEMTRRKPGSAGLVMAGGKANPYAGTTGAARTNSHPTVKPLALMRWLITLITPPGGIVLDPFGGSGSTGVAAILEGVRPILIEREAEYLPIIQARLAWAVREAGLPTVETPMSTPAPAPPQKRAKARKPASVPAYASLTLFPDTEEVMAS